MTVTVVCDDWRRFRDRRRIVERRQRLGCIYQSPGDRCLVQARLDALGRLLTAEYAARLIDGSKAAADAKNLQVCWLDSGIRNFGAVGRPAVGAADNRCPP